MNRRFCAGLAFSLSLGSAALAEDRVPPTFEAFPVGTVADLSVPRSYYYRHIPGQQRYVDHSFRVNVNKSCNESADLLPKLTTSTVVPVTPCFFQVRLSEIAWTGGADVTIQLSDGVTKYAYKMADVSKSNDLWSGPLRGSQVSFSIDYTTGNAPDILSFEVKEAAIDRRSGGVLSITGGVDSREHTIVAVQGNSGLAGASRSVAHMSLVAGGLRATCTGFMVSPRLMMTNAHCIPDQDVCNTAYITFGYRYELDGSWANTEVYRCSKLFIPSETALDLAVIELNGAAGAAGAWGHVVPGDSRSDAMYLVQHPWGQPQQISRVDCKVGTESGVGNDPSKETDFGHLCDTLRGSSGSPLLNASNEIVGLHHLGTDSTNPSPWDEENRAVKVELILERLTEICAGDSGKCIDGWH